MRRRGPLARLLLVAASVGAGWAAGACTRCDVDCAAPSRVEEVVAEVRSTDDDGVVRVRTDAGESLDVRIVGGSPDDLATGTSYRFPLRYLVVGPETEGGPGTTAAPDAGATTAPEPGADPATDPAAADAAAAPVAFFPDDCDCTDAYISDLDGDVIDPGLDVPFRRLAIAFIAGSFLLAGVWAATRWYREVPL